MTAYGVDAWTDGLSSLQGQVGWVVKAAQHGDWVKHAMLVCGCGMYFSVHGVTSGCWVRGP